MTTFYWQWSRLVPARLLDAWEERIGALSGTTFSATLLPGGRSARLHLYASTERSLRGVTSRFGGTIIRRTLTTDLATGLIEFHLPIGDRLTLSSTPAGKDKAATAHLWIPAGMAFGTGQHATTALCLRRLADLIRPGSSGTLLDVGTGSGVLALAAARFGWKPDAFDNDPEAIREARRNAKRNGLSRAVRFQIASVETFVPTAPYDIVVANLFAALHEKFLPFFGNWCKPDGHLVLSGILTDQEESVRRAVLSAKLRIKRRWRSGKWICLLASPESTRRHPAPQH